MGHMGLLWNVAWLGLGTAWEARPGAGIGPSSLWQPPPGNPTHVSEPHVLAAVPGTSLPRTEGTACLLGPPSRWSKGRDPPRPEV